MLIGNLHTLHAIHFLNLIDEILLHFGNAFDRKNIVRIDGAIGKTFARTNGIAFLDKDVLTERNRIFPAVRAIVRCHYNDTRAAARLLEVDRAINFGNRRGIAW